MPVLRKRAQGDNKIVNGLFIHSNPPRLLQLNSAYIRQLIRQGDVEKLEHAVLEGQGKKLIGEYSPDYKTRTFLKSIPALMSKMSLLHDAVNSGKLSELKSLLNEEPEKKKKLVMAKDESGVGLLHKAVYYDLKDIYKWLIEKYPATVSLRDSEGRTAYHYTPMCKDPVGVQKLLTNAGADVTAIDNNQHTAKYYMEHKQDLELPSGQKSTTTSRKNTAKKEHSLNFKKSNIRIWIHQRNMANLQQVVWEGHGGMLLVEHSNNPKIKKFLEAIPHILGLIKDIHLDVQNDDLEKLKERVSPPTPPIVLTGKDANGLTPLHKAAGLDKQNIAEYIIQQYPESINYVDNEGRTPLHYAALLKDDGKMTNFLIQYGADESILDHKQKTAAYYKTRHSEIDSKLLNVVPDCPRSAKESFAANFDWNILSSSTSMNWIQNGTKKALEQVELKHNDEEHEETTNNRENLNGNEELVQNGEHSLEEEKEDLKAAEVTENAEPEALNDVEEANDSKPSDPDVKPEENPESGQQAVPESHEIEEKEAADEEEDDKNKLSKKESIENKDDTNEEEITDNNNNDTEVVESEDTKEEEITEEPKSRPVSQKTRPNSSSEAIKSRPSSQKARPTSNLQEKSRPTSNLQEKSRPTSNLQDISRPASNLQDISRTTNNLQEKPSNLQEISRPASNLQDISRPTSNLQEKPSNLQEISRPISKTSEKNAPPVEEGERIIEGIVNGENEVEAMDNEGMNEPRASDKDDEVKVLVDAGNMEQLAAMVLNGEGARLVGMSSDNTELQTFLENVPTYMSKIHKIHEAARNGSLRNLQAALDRRKFAIAKDNISPKGTSPLHVAVIFGNTSIVRYLAGRFPETLQMVDDEGKTPLHYAAVLNDNGHYYNLLVHLGADMRAEDKFGFSPEYYRKNQQDFNHKSLLRDFGAEEDEADEILADKDKLNAENGQVDMPFFATEEGRYLASSLGDPLIKGLTEVANKRPNDPIAYLAQYLYNFANNRNNIRSRGKVQEESQQIVTGSPTHEENNNAIPATIDVVTVEPDEDDKEEESAFNPTSRDEHGQSMVHFAAARSHGRNALFQLLQETEVNVAFRDELYRTARDISIQANLPDNTEEIDRYVLYIATKGDTDKLVELLLDGYDHITDIVDSDDVPIVEAVSNANQPDTVSFLQSILAFEEKRERVHHAIRQGSINDVNLLLADENDTGSGKLLAIGKNSYGRCTIHIAVLCQQEEIVDYLANAFPETLKLGDNLERTALHYAMGVEKMETISRVLIKAGAARVRKDLKGRQPTYYFLNKSEILRLQEEEEMF